ncbi:MAG: hypothetical protein V1903_09705 [Bacteroidota bacterium]
MKAVDKDGDSSLRSESPSSSTDYLMSSVPGYVPGVTVLSEESPYLST